MDNIQTKPMATKCSGFFMNENDCLLTVLYETYNTTSEGLNFESFQKQFSDLQGLSPAYIFPGSPDVLIKGKDNNFIPLSSHCDIRVIEIGQKLTTLLFRKTPCIGYLWPMF